MATFRSTMSVNAAYGGAATRGGTGDNACCGGLVKGEDDEYYFMCQHTNGGGLIAVRVSDATRLTAGTTELSADAGAGTYTFNQRLQGGAVGDGVHGFCLGQDLTGSFSSRWGIGFYKVNAAGALEAAWTGLYRSNSLAGENNPPDDSAVCAGLYGGYFVILLRDGTALRSACLQPPGANVSEDALVGSSWPWDARVITVSDPAIVEGGHFDSSPYRIVNGAGWFANDHLYSILTRGDVAYEVANPGQPAPSDLINTTTYADGAIIKFTTSTSVNADGFPAFNITGYSVDNASWVGFPWSDQSRQIDGTTVDNGDDYQRFVCSVAWRTHYVITFLKVYDADGGAGGDTDPTGTRFKVRAYAGVDGNWVEVSSAEGNCYNTETDAGVGSSSKYSNQYPRCAIAGWHPDMGKIAVLQQLGGTAPTPLTNDYVVAQFADFTITDAPRNYDQQVNF